MLLDQTALDLPPDQVVVEILESVVGDPSVLQACHALRRAGYQIALDDVVGLSADDLLLGVADILKVDFRDANRDHRRAIAEVAASLGLLLLAKKVETPADVQEALSLGYRLFQGYFFQKPEVIARRDVPVATMTALRLAKELYRSDVDWGSLERMLRQDVGLSVKLLRYLNSAWFGLAQRVESLRHALILLGVEGLRRWASLILVTDLGRGKSPELLTLCLLRPAMCERLAAATRLTASGPNLFLVGLLSLLDVLVGRPLGELLDEMTVPIDVRDALVRPTSRLSGVYRLVLAYERGDWPHVTEQAQGLGINEEILPAIFFQSLGWVQQVTAASAFAVR